MHARVPDVHVFLLAGAVVATLVACAHPRPDPVARLALYRDHAGAPVAAFDYVRNMRWEALGDQSLAVWPRRETGFLLEMASPCPGLDQARAIQISHAERRVRARLDSVRVLSMPGSPPLQRAPCPIMLISPLQVPTAASQEALRVVEPEPGD